MGVEGDNPVILIVELVFLEEARGTGDMSSSSSRQGSGCRFVALETVETESVEGGCGVVPECNALCDDAWVRRPKG